MTNQALRRKFVSIIRKKVERADPPSPDPRDRRKRKRNQKPLAQQYGPAHLLKKSRNRASAYLGLCGA